jgi:lipoyl(octanoyl) transferase
VFALQRRLVYEIAGDLGRRVIVLCCEHPDVITVGRHGSRAHVRRTAEQLRCERLSLRWVGRGGGCVLHAPGQLCIYPLLSLESFGWSVGEYLRRLQAGLCATLQDLNVRPQVYEGQFGIWGRSGLLAALGVAVRKWITSHGAFLNVHPALDRYAWIDALPPEAAPAGQRTTFSCLLAERRLAVRMSGVRAALVPRLAESFSCSRYHIHTGHPLLRKLSESRRESVARAS